MSASSASSRESLHPGTFHADLPNGATVAVTVPATRIPDDSLERLRQDARVPRATYATVDIDNSHGQSPVSVSRLVLTARDGATYQLEHPARALKRWYPRASGDTHRAKDGTSLDARTAQDLVRRLDDAASRAVGDIAVGEKGRNILIGDISAVPRDFASLEIVPLIGDREVAPVQVHPREAEDSASGSGSPDASERDGTGGSGAGATPAPGQEVPPDNPLPGEDPQPSTSPTPTSPARPEDPVAPKPVVPEPVVPDPVVPQPVVPDPVVLDPVVPDPSVPREADPAPAAPGVAALGSAVTAPSVARPAAESDDEPVPTASPTAP
ncbi:hypothetical protein [Kocuria sp.]|uniref:hypothetical protein n=1 Tax=Kocuria sp. TaxID=1871328 RepID=UPI0026DBC063|nr:hypothetical protein [Kocuria sp.]MDO4918488.1 hypothetical protein [Kocuria sp.]